MKKTIIMGIMFLILINVVSAEELYSKESDACKIIVQDYMQEYIDYECEVINLTAYTLKYKINNNFFFDVINNCTFDDDDCSDDFAKEKNETVKEFAKETKKILGFGEMYNYDEYLDNYLTKKNKKDKKEDINKLKKEKEFPIEYLTQNIKHKGKINPFNKNGEIIIDTKKDSYNKIRIGYGSVIIEFNNSLESENINMYYKNGFGYKNRTRYLELSKFLVLNESSMKVTGVSSDKAPFYEYDYFISSINDDRWSNYSTTEVDGANKCSHVTFNDNYIYALTSGHSSDPCNGEYMGEAILNTNNSELSFNLAEDFSFLINYTYLNKLTIEASGTTGTSSAFVNLIKDDNSEVLAVHSNTITSGSSATQQGTEFLKIIYNTTSNLFKIYNYTGDLISSDSVSGTYDVYLKFKAYAYKLEGCSGSGCGVTSETSITINAVGYSKNIVEVSDWNISNPTYPENFNLSIGGVNVYNKAVLDSEIKVNFSAQLQGVWDSCNCYRCISSTESCIVPVDFYSTSGGIINYSEINITYLPAKANISVNIYDSNTLNKINTTNITLQIIGEQYQTELITEDGNASFQFFFNSLAEDLVSIRAFSGDIQDYSIITRNIIMSSANETTEINLYLTNTSDTDKAIDIQFIALNAEGLDRLENALVKVYKQNPSTNEDVLLTELYTHSDGQATTKLISETVFYRFAVEYRGTIVYTSQNAISLTAEDSPLKLYCILQPAYSEGFLSYAGLALELDFNKINNESGYYSILYSGQGQYEICFNDYYIINTVRTNSTDYCVNGSSGSSSFSTISVNQFADVYGEVSIDFKNGEGKERYMTSHEYLGLDDISRQAKSRLFVYFGLILICGIVFVYYPSVALILFILATSALSYTKFILLDPGVSMLIISLTIFVLITYNRKK